MSETYSRVRLDCLIEHFDTVAIQLENVIQRFNTLANEENKALFGLPLKWAKIMWAAVTKISAVLDKNPDDLSAIRLHYNLLNHFYVSRFEKMAYSASKILWPTGFTAMTSLSLYEEWQHIDSNCYYVVEKVFWNRNHPLHDEFMLNFSFDFNPVRCDMTNYIRPDVRNNVPVASAFFFFLSSEESNGELEGIDFTDFTDGWDEMDGSESANSEEPEDDTDPALFELSPFSWKVTHELSTFSVCSFGSTASIPQDVDYLPVELGDFSLII